MTVAREPWRGRRARATSTVQVSRSSARPWCLAAGSIQDQGGLHPRIDSCRSITHSSGDQPMQEPRLEGRTALVTGGGRGIGRSTALALARCGARVVISGRGREALEDVAAEVRGLGGEALPVEGDVSREEDVRRLLEEAGPVDILVNNAGVIGPMAPLASS